MPDERTGLRQGLSHAPIRSLLVQVGWRFSGHLQIESTDHFEGTAPVPIRVRPELEVARVILSPYTYSGTFSETSDSPGWWIFDTVGNPLYKLPVGGNIVHSSQGDIWQFVNFGNAGGGYQTLGRGEGTANGNFPNANAVSGTITFTTQSRLGTVTGTVKWSGKRVK